MNTTIITKNSIIIALAVALALDHKKDFVHKYNHDTGEHHILINLLAPDYVEQQLLTNQLADGLEYSVVDYNPPLNRLAKYMKE